MVETKRTASAAQRNTVMVVALVIAIINIVVGSTAQIVFGIALIAAVAIYWVVTVGLPRLRARRDS